MHDLILPPYAPVFLDSLRALGYSAELAFADIVDNSITAHADCVQIFLAPVDGRCAFIDNGRGMSPEELTEAMRHGGNIMAQHRSDTDLGRFGLGLKTASLSQCRRLVVVSKRNTDAHPVARIWDLDEIERAANWVLLSSDDSGEVLKLPYATMLMDQGSGTLVLWEKLDRFINHGQTPEDAFQHRLDLIEPHLSLTYHRFLSASGKDRSLKILINGRLIQPTDPFFTKNSATQKLQVEEMRIDGHRISILPYILPHTSKLTREERLQLQNEDGGRAKQGVYVYRNKRLMVHGTWFRLHARDELSKLARVQVDFPSALDHLWKPDVRKANLELPVAVRDSLGRIVNRIVGQSKQVFRHRGRKTNQENFEYVWDRIETREGIRYNINRDHPVISAVISSVASTSAMPIEHLLRLIEQTIPIHALYNDMATRADIALQGTEERQLRAKIDELFDLIAALPAENKDLVLRSIIRAEPFSRHPDLVERLIKEKISK